GFYERQPTAGLWVPLAFVGVFLVRGLASYASSYKISSVSQAVLVELRRRMFERLLHWPQTTIENTPSGMVISKFINEASNALNLAAEVMTTAVRDSLSVVALLGVLLFYNWPLTLLTVGISLALWRARAGSLSGGEFIMFLASALLLLQPVRHLSSLNGPIARMSAAADSVFAMIDSAQEADEGTVEIERARGAIEFR